MSETSYQPTASPINWEYLGLTTATGAVNMATDGQLLEQFQSEVRKQPVLRFYLWNPPSISLGRNQSGEVPINLDVAKARGYDVVTRPTGGRALLHKGDICYAVIADRRSHPLFHSLTTTYRAVGGAIAVALDNLGVNRAESVAAGNDSRRSLNPCFALMSPYEVTVRGMKICGSAQYRAGDVFLQHGSLRLRDNWDEGDLVELWPEGCALDGGKITSLDRELGRSSDSAMVALALKKAFGQVFQIEFVDGKL